MNPKVSIIVPIYNVEKYLKRCINSILNQTLKEFELILVNDGSTDKSKEICDEYKDERIKVIHKINEGVSSARNKGIDIAKGDYICFIDPDDYIDKDAIEYLYNLNIKNGADIACYRMKTYKNEVLQSKLNIKENIEIYIKENIIKEYAINGKFLYSTCNKLYDSKLFNNIRFSENIRYAEDALINYYLLSKSSKLVMSNLQKYNYCINESGVVSNINEKRLDILKAQKIIFYFLNKRYKKYTNYIAKQYIRSSILIVQDIAIEGTVLSKKSLLNKLRCIVKQDKDILSNIENLTLSDKIYFSILKRSPILLGILYRFKFLISNFLRNKYKN